MTLLSPAPLRQNRPPLPEEPQLSESDFQRIAAFSQREFGLCQSGDKKQLVHSRLIRLLRETGCPDIATLLLRLETDPQCRERTALISALTTNVTAFFREPHHFRQLADELLRPRLEALRRGARLRIWSAGCSAGQEPCSIALTILDHLPEACRLNIRILATDIDAAMISRARRGLYSAEECSGLSAQMEREHFRTTPDGQRQIGPEAGEMIRYAALNLIEDWPVQGPFDAIFCRNVAIYFDKPTQMTLWQRFARLLAPGGLLFIGHSERVSGPAGDCLTSAGITTYRLSATPDRRMK
ncbi:CheR family methyltransferase [Pseudogemmobacter faecipullorum]|uniref:Chemotaxis protein methyltransferase n=1 Tax=Pseudogemmobacter faecipullorum TaxID=2755041 RepID=A0ABS8CLJ1_9RHOB|nr:protein-glutamate O-methyltransferase CheR [Pseudogemmobacter faecipullorum]MCB5410262.1 protein-glutamate O-methyltransferase CheR [Pseudogemmobacter faecipullorum]